MSEPLPRGEITFDVIHHDGWIRVCITGGMATLYIDQIWDDEIVVRAINKAIQAGATRGTMFTGEIVNDRLAEKHRRPNRARPGLAAKSPSSRMAKTAQSFASIGTRCQASRNEVTMRDYQRLAPILSALPSDPYAVMRYDLYADALVWSDEVPKPGSDHGEILIAAELRGIWHYRTSLVLGKPKEKFRPAWDEALRCFPSWPGFAAERQRVALASTFLQMQSEVTNKSEQMEDCIDAELARRGLNV